MSVTHVVTSRAVARAAVLAAGAALCAAAATAPAYADIDVKSETDCYSLVVFTIHQDGSGGITGFDGPRYRQYKPLTDCLLLPL